MYQAIKIFAFVSTTILLLQCFNYKTGILYNYVYFLDTIIPNHKLLNGTDVDTKKRQTPFNEKSRPSVKKNLPSQMHFCKKKQTNPLFQDENHYKITFKCRDFYSANAFRNLKAAFDSVRAIISNDFFIFLH